MTRGIRKPLPQAAAHLPSPNCPDAKTSGWRRYVQVARLKASRPYDGGLFSTPTPVRCTGVVFILKTRGMDMPQKLKFDTSDFTPPRSLKDALQRSALELDCLLIWMRNKARFHEAMDYRVLDAANLAVNMVEDKLTEMQNLIPEIERRVSGADLA